MEEDFKKIKKNNNLLIAIIMITFLLIGLIAFFIYEQFIETNAPLPENNITDIQDDENDKEEEEELIEIPTHEDETYE